VESLGKNRPGLSGGNVARPRGTVSASTALVTQTLRIETLIDGRSQLIVRANTSQWFHLDCAAPGRHLFRNEPTVINEVDWFPVWLASILPSRRAR